MILLKKFEYLPYLEAAAIILLFLIITLIILKKPKVANVDGIKIKKKSSVKGFSTAQIVTIGLVSAGLSILLTMFVNTGYVTSIIIFATAAALIPYAIVNNQKRVKAELLFNDIILYCQNTCMMLRQTKNATKSVETIMMDVRTPEFKEDLGALVVALGRSRTVTREIMDIIEAKYSYTIIRSLDTMLMYMAFDNTQINVSMLDSFHDQVTDLNKSVRRNDSLRNTKRITYIIVAILSYFSYWWFINIMKSSISTLTSTNEFVILNTVFTTALLISTFYTDSYFNNHITQE